MHKFFAKTEYLGKKVIFLPQCHSTNEVAQNLIATGEASEGTTIITKDQTKGKGQRGNIWESEPGKNITFSIILNPAFISPSEQFLLHVISSLAVYDMLFNILGKGLKVKWPNDIYFKNKKIGGILIENTIRGKKIESSIIGIGVNTNQINFHNQNAISLKEATMLDFEINDLIEKIIIAIENRYNLSKTHNSNDLLTLYERRMFRLGIPSKFRDSLGSFEGVIDGVDSSGKLIVSVGQKQNLFDFKEVELLIN